MDAGRADRWTRDTRQSSVECIGFLGCNALGLKSFFFTLKLERAGHRADLRALVEDDRAALAKACGEGHAGVFARRLDKLPG